ncbi:MAG: NF038122 family metalloprotease [Planctomycetota bacterium]
MNIVKYGWAVCFVVGALAFSGPVWGQLTFNTSTSSNAEADTAFDAATNAWAIEFDDAMTVNIDISFSNLGGTSLANTASANQANTFTEFTNAINADVFSADDGTFAAGLPVGSSFSVYINRTTEAAGADNEVPYVDADGGLNNTTVRLTTANAKSLGLRSANDSGLDGTIVFNDSFTWDFDRSDGIDPGAIDFVGVAMHEIGHVLGFESGVDVLDSNGDGLSTDDEFDFVGSIDFLRFSNESEVAGADIDWTADDRPKYFSIDGGATPIGGGGSQWATGFEFGDGDQASHWKDGAGLGLMSPITGSGALVNFTGNDLRAFDVIGYNRFNAVPEPAAMTVMLLASSCLLMRRRRKTSL